jgi:maltoporin
MHRNKRLKMLPLAAAVLMMAAGTASALEFHGYFRSGIGWGSKKGGETCFKLPGVPGNGNYRLGNECETYGEAEFGQNLYDGKDGVKFDYHLMFATKVGQQQDYEQLPSGSNEFALRQNWVEAKNLPFLNGGSAWVGKRYYQRHDVHINDFFYWDTSGPGAGIENFKLGGIKSSVAVFRSNGNNASNDPNANATTRLDWRFHGIDLGAGGSLEAGLQYNTADTTKSNTKSGSAINIEHSLPVLGGVNKFFVVSGTGSANAPYLAYPNNTPGTQDGTTGVQDSLQWQISPDFSGMAYLGYWKFKNNYTWSTAGIRPVWHMGDYFKIQAELGRNNIKPQGGDTRTLDKLTIAPTLVAGRGFWTRPELRFFYTYAKWNNAARDQWGGVAGGTGGPFGTGTNGSSYGFQVEAWW